MIIHFLAIPKTGGISIKEFCDYNKIPIVWHNRNLDKTKSKIYNCDKLFCVLRNPIDRVMSAYSYLKNGGINDMDKQDWDTYCGRFTDINTFIENNLIVAETEQIHFRSQYKWLLDMSGNIHINKIEVLKFERLNEDLKNFQQRYNLKKFNLKHNNRSNRNGVILNDNSISIIKDIYQRDYDLINKFKNEFNHININPFE